MGIHSAIDHTKFPTQGTLLGKKVSVIFHYNTKKYISGLCVRDDVGDPGLTIFHLEDDRFVLATECQFSID